MKRYYPLLLSWVLLLFAFGCKDFHNYTSDDTPQINFTHPRYILTKDMTIKIPVEADVEPSGRVTVPYTISAEDLKAGEDYSVTPSEITFEPGRTIDTLYLKGLKTIPQRTLMSVKLDEVPNGYKKGVMSFVSVDFLATGSLSLTFKESQTELPRKIFIPIELKEGKYAFAAVDDLEVGFNVDPRSTAVENVHFRFPDGPKGLIKRSNVRGGINVEWLKNEEGHDKLYLRIAPMEGYVPGNDPVIEIDIQGPLNPTGTWTYVSMLNKDYLGTAMSFNVSNAVEGKKGDEITFTGGPDDFSYEAKLDPKGLGCYFPKFGTLKFNQEMTVYLQEESGFPPPQRVFSEYLADKLNVNFSPNSQKFRPGYFNMRTHRGDKGEEYLDITIYDIEPTDFLGELMEWGFIDPTAPEQTRLSILDMAYCRYRFVRK